MSASTSSRRMGLEQRDLLRTLAYCYLQHGHPGRALPLLRLLLELDAADRHAADSLACALVRLGRGEEALEVMQQMSAFHDATALSFLLRAQALAMLGRMPEAARAMRRFVALRREANTGDPD